MKILLSFTILYVCSFANLNTKIQDRSIDYSNSSNPNYRCRDKGDSQYTRLEIIQLFTEVINKQFDSKIALIDEHNTARRFFIYDLVDLENKDIGSKRVRDNCIQFFEGHIYHFALGYFPDSFSNIAFLHKGEVTIFEAINCKYKGDSYQEVIDYILPFFEDSDNKAQIIDNLVNYRNYGSYAAGCPESYKLNCDCDPCR